VIYVLQVVAVHEVSAPALWKWWVLMTVDAPGDGRWRAHSASVEPPIGVSYDTRP